MTSSELERLSLEVEELREELLAAEAELEPVLGLVHPQNLASARNLVHYLALRRRDVRALQLRLARAGLSSLGRSESHVVATLNQVISMLALARGTKPPSMAPPPVRFREGQRKLAANARRLLGRRRPQRAVRIVVTLPSEAAEDPRFAYDLIAAGMDCARINCARDDATTWSAMADNVRAGSRANGRECRILVDLGGPKLRTGMIAGGADALTLCAGDHIELVREPADLSARQQSLPRIACAAPALFEAVQAGHEIWFDDGVLGGLVEKKTAEGLLIRLTHSPADGAKLRPERGINLPEVELMLPALTQQDVQDLAHVVSFANAIEFSFVQRAADVDALQNALRAHDADHMGIILKIETRRAFEDLPQLMLTAMQWRDCGVMVARGDLAVEVGFERMAEIQEEMLWIGEAAHMPTIWATKVLDSLAKRGALSRAEMTDAAMSARAEAVMLNKGPFVIDAIATLDQILSRMKEHQSKKRPLFRALNVTRSLWE